MLSKSHSRSCVGTGFIVLDMIQSSFESTPTNKYFAGGSCGNVLAILAYLGWDATAVGRIGSDFAGNELKLDLEKWGVKTQHLTADIGRRTPVIIQENYLDNKGKPRHRFFRACPTCGTNLPSYRPILLNTVSTIAKNLSSHSVFYFDRVAPGNLDLAKKSRANGSIVVFEPSGIKDKQLFEQCLSVSHVVKYANDRVQGAHEWVSESDVPIEVETLGSKGLRLRVRKDQHMGSWIELPAFQIPELIDASGAGDWTTAGLINNLVTTPVNAENMLFDVDAIVSSLREGQAMAALNCGFEGARGIMYAAQAQAVLELAKDIVNGNRVAAPTEIKQQISPNGTNANSICPICILVKEPN